MQALLCLGAGGVQLLHEWICRDERGQRGYRCHGECYGRNRCVLYMWPLRSCLFASICRPPTQAFSAVAGVRGRSRVRGRVRVSVRLRVRQEQGQGQAGAGAGVFLRGLRAPSIGPVAATPVRNDARGV